MEFDWSAWEEDEDKCCCGGVESDWVSHDESYSVAEVFDAPLVDTETDGDKDNNEND